MTVTLVVPGAGWGNQQPVFRAGTEVVQLDVSVLDKDRKPIRDLTKTDFTVLEDGNPRQVVAFSAVDVPNPPPVAGGATDVEKAKTWKRDITPDVTTNAHRQRAGFSRWCSMTDCFRLTRELLRMRRELRQVSSIT